MKTLLGSSIVFITSACAADMSGANTLSLKCELAPYMLSTQIIGETARSAEFGKPTKMIIQLDRNTQTYSIFESGEWIARHANIHSWNSTQIILSEVRQLPRNSSDSSFTKIDLISATFVDSHHSVNSYRVQSMKRSGSCINSLTDEIDLSSPNKR